MGQSSSKTLELLLPVLKDVRAKSTLTPDRRRTDRRSVVETTAMQQWTQRKV
ncbi:unnamed protein product, partial [Closterium sp. NIES-54]